MREICSVLDRIDADEPQASSEPLRSLLRGLSVSRSNLIN